jgi:hypothetical protein
MSHSEPIIIVHLYYDEGMESAIVVSRINGWYRPKIDLSTVLIMAGGNNICVTETMEEIQKLWDEAHAATDSLYKPQLQLPK